MGRTFANACETISAARRGRSFSTSIIAASAGLSLAFCSASDAADLPAKTHPHADPAGWQPVPLIGPEVRARGEAYGGEGGQWIQSLAVDATDGSFLLYGIDVAGLLRSLDGGTTWEPANVGLHTRGASGAAIDPNFPDRALLIGTNSMPSGRHGIFLSEDRAGSWEHVLPIEMCGIRDIRDQIAFDATTRDDALGLTRDVYWSRLAVERPGYGTIEPDPAMYRSADGGRSWSRLPDSAHIAGGVLRADPHATGRLLTYGGGQGEASQGLFLTEDRAATWREVRRGVYTGLDFCRVRAGVVWLTDAGNVLRSEDGGVTFVRHDAASDALARPGYTLRGIEVSPADPDRLLLWRQDDDGWDWTWHVSHDGGATWTQTRHDNAKAFLPQNERQGVFAWHPTDPNVVVATGGDWPTRSVDGGRTFAWSARGFYGMLVGGSFQFNPNHPDTVLFASQDYNGAVTHDGGRNWRYVNIANKSWGGFCYGGYAVDGQRMFAAEADDWGGLRVLRVTRDGGATWELRDDVVYDSSRKARTGQKPADAPPYGFRIAYASPADPDVWFFGSLRSDDAGHTWTPMAGCDGVFGVPVTGPDPSGGVPGAGGATLVGLNYDAEANRTHLVLSEDHGATWTSLTDAPGQPNDVAYDATTRTAYIAAGGQLFRHRLDEASTPVQLDPPRDQFNGRRIRSVALDPHDPLIVYAAQNKDVYSVSAAAMRSIDGGDTWEILTRQTPLDGTGLDGGREAFFVRVHPVTREPWFITGCYGTWRYAAP